MLQQDIDNRRQEQRKPSHSAALQMPKPEEKREVESFKSSLTSATTSASQEGLAALVAALIPGGLGVLQRQEQNRTLITQGSNLQSLNVPRRSHSNQTVTIASGRNTATAGFSPNDLVLPKRKGLA